MTSWAIVAACVGAACGGSSDDGLFGSPGEATSSSSSSASSSGATGSSSGSTASSSSGTSGTSSGGSSGASGTDDAGVHTCRPSVPSDCGDGEYCKVNGCATAGGTCTKKPANVPDNGSPIVCGCDNVTYWNEALAASFGVSVKTTGTCPLASAAKCGTLSDCPDKRYCNRQLREGSFCTAAATIEGTCWGIPDPCPKLANGKANACGDTIKQCTTFCEAVRAEDPWFPNDSCQ